MLGLVLNDLISRNEMCDQKEMNGIMILLILHSGRTHVKLVRFSSFQNVGICVASKQSSKYE